MKAQKPAEGILLVDDWGNRKMYKIACRCHQPDHEHTVDVEADDAGVNVNIYVIAKTNFWGETFSKRYDINNIWLQEMDWLWKDAINSLINRLQLSWKVWTKGYLETQTIVDMSEQQALNYAEAIKTAIEDVKEFKAMHKNKKNS